MEEMTKDRIIEEIYQGNQGFITRREIDERKIPSWFLSSFVKKKGLKKIAPGFMLPLILPWMIIGFFKPVTRNTSSLA